MHACGRKYFILCDIVNPQLGSGLGLGLGLGLGSGLGLDSVRGSTISLKMKHWLTQVVTHSAITPSDRGFNFGAQLQ